MKIEGASVSLVKVANVELVCSRVWNDALRVYPGQLSTMIVVGPKLALYYPNGYYRICLKCSSPKDLDFTSSNYTKRSFLTALLYRIIEK